MLTFHAIGDWSNAQIRISRAPSSRKIVPEVERLIDEAWEKVASQPGVHLFDGPMCRLESWAVASDRLDLALSPTSYKPFLGTNLHHPELADRYGREILANPVGVSPALETADGWLMMGRRNASVAYYPNRVHPFAGALEPRDAMDLFGAVRRELAEELGFSPEDVAEIRCTGIAEDRAIRQPELIFRVLSTRTRAQVAATLDRTEHHATWAIRADQGAVEASLQDVSGMTPVAVAAVLLWGARGSGKRGFAIALRGSTMLGERVFEGTPAGGVILRAATDEPDPAKYETRKEKLETSLKEGENAKFERHSFGFQICFLRICF